MQNIHLFLHVEYYSRVSENTITSGYDKLREIRIRRRKSEGDQGGGERNKRKGTEIKGEIRDEERRLVEGGTGGEMREKVRLRDTVAYRACRACERELPVEQSQYSEIQRRIRHVAKCLYMRARALIIIAIYNASVSAGESSGKTKTVLIAAVLAINSGTV